MHCATRSEASAAGHEDFLYGHTEVLSDPSPQPRSAPDLAVDDPRQMRLANPNRIGDAALSDPPPQQLQFQPL